MQFVHPEVLWALSALAIPVLVHLFSFRRHRKVQFSQTAFLREVKQESRSRSRIRHWLVLLMRLLAMACIILAFAQPVLDQDTANGQKGGRTLALYIDNSPSMELEGANGPLLEAAKSGASALVDAAGPTDRFQVFTSDFAPSDRRTRSREEALERIAAIRPGSSAPRIGDVLLQAQDRLSAENGEGTAYLFTDLQASSHGLSPALTGQADSSLAVRFVTQSIAPTVNVRIDSAWFDTPMRLTGRSEVLHVRISHDAQRPVDDLPLSLDLNGRRMAIGSYGLRPGLDTDTVLRFRHEAAGHVHATVRTVDAPVTFDDALHFGYEVSDRVKVVLIQGRSAGPAEQVALQRLFADATLHDVTDMSEGGLDYAVLTEADLVVVQGVDNPNSGLVSALLEAVESGQSAWLIPPGEQLGDGWNELLMGLGIGQPGAWIALDEPARLGELHHAHPLYDGVFSQAPRRVDLPSVRGWFGRQRPGPSERRILSFADGKPFLTAGELGAGRFYWLAGPLATDWSNLAQHALLVPTALRMAETARASGLRQFEAGREADLTVRGMRGVGTEGWTLQSAADSAFRTLLNPRNFPGGFRVELPLNELRPGPYTLALAEDDRKTPRTILTLGVNPPSAESDLTTLDPEGWKQALVTAGWRQAEVLSSDVQELVDAVDVLEDGDPAWLGMIALALLFLFLEMVLLKRKSAAPSPATTTT